ncbi:MAG: UbiA family prenyltransferase [Candidatus Bathyarchaeota archaeon]
MKERLKAYLDLMRLHFFFVWPILFCSGIFLAFQIYGGFSLLTILKGILIGFFGFEAGLILNDIVDRDIDKKEIETDKLTKYWRVFGKRPIPEDLISSNNALILFFVFVTLTSILIFTFPTPNSFYLFGIMIICYCLEYFYQIKKRKQTFPFAQLIGRIDFTLFPVAGYLSVAIFDINALFFALFFYPLALAHLGVNDIADVVNDQAKNMKTIPILYGIKGATYWVLIFTLLHYISATIFLTILGTVTLIGFSIGFILLTIANYQILKAKSAIAGMKVLPLFHVAMLIYAISIVLGYFI